ncbi:uncharacterized protein LOC143892785 isoform X2 [Tasmannia lanceolata]
MKSSGTIYDRKDPVVCPKPRRLGLLIPTVNDPVRPSRFHLSHPKESCDPKAERELIDIIKGVYGSDQIANQVASSPPYFCGSPPIRAANPLIHDARFGDEKVALLSPLPIPSGLSPSPSTSGRKSGFVRNKFSHNPTVRIEGFDCLDRDRRNCSIPAFA